MTREEIKELKGLATSMGLYDDKNPCKRAVILGKAIKALEQELCEDAISREMAIDLMEDIETKRLKGEIELMYAPAIKGLKELPPVTPAEKVGQWIPVSERLPEEYKEVIVTDIETSDTYQSRYIGNGYWECDNGLFMNRIIAWMPKPKPYVPDINVSKKSASPTGEGEE